jgi:hypothetical protein
VGWRTDPENYRWQGNLSQRTAAGTATAEFIVGNPGWIRPLILQKSGGLQGSFAYLADCADPGGGCVFVMKEFGSGGFTAAVAATNGADRSTRTTRREALSVGIGFGSLIDRSIRVTSA